MTSPPPQYRAALLLSNNCPYGDIFSLRNAPTSRQVQHHRVLWIYECFCSIVSGWFIGGSISRCVRVCVGGCVSYCSHLLNLNTVFMTGIVKTEHKHDHNLPLHLTLSHYLCVSPHSSLLPRKSISCSLHSKVHYSFLPAALSVCYRSHSHYLCLSFLAPSLSLHYIAKIRSDALPPLCSSCFFLFILMPVWLSLFLSLGPSFFSSLPLPSLI